MSGMEISSCPLTQASVKTSWVGTNFRFLAAFLEVVTHPMVSVVKVKFPTLEVSLDKASNVETQEREKK